MTIKSKPSKNKIWMLAAVIVAVMLLLTYFLISGDEDGSNDHTLTLYGFSVKGEVMDEDVIPAFQQYWLNKTGESVKFQTTYAGSSQITNQVIGGSPADVMILSTEWDALQLKKAGFTTTDWNSLPNNGTVSTSPWVIMVREGNPLGIHGFDDLAKPGVELVHADPLTSGGACWSIFSIYGSEMIKTNGNETEATELLSGVMNNVVSWQPSARDALSQFNLGYGDALITYENDALLAKSKDTKCDIIYPNCTIYSEHKVVIVDKNVKKSEREVVDAFVDFMFTDEVQGYMVDYNFRSSVNESFNNNTDFGVVQHPFYVSYLGGWEVAHQELIDGLFTTIKNK